MHGLRCGCPHTQLSTISILLTTYALSAEEIGPKAFSAVNDRIISAFAYNDQTVEPGPLRF